MCKRLNYNLTSFKTDNEIFYILKTLGLSPESVKKHKGKSTTRNEKDSYTIRINKLDEIRPSRFPAKQFVVRDKTTKIKNFILITSHYFVCDIGILIR